jgi:pyruvate ferredoxin oxidoreductase gamma subunit
MIRVRFHGRGGQGMKTASRILGATAFHDHFTVQDSPVYGAERRGAPMSAFVRIDRGPIHERGPITRPDLVVVADDTLLGDRAATPLAGLTAEGVLLVATRHPEAEVRRHTGHGGLIVARDFAASGAASAASTGLAAAATALLGLSRASMERAIREELPGVGVTADQVEAAVVSARAARASAGPEVLLGATVLPGAAPGAVVEVVAEPVERASATITAAPNTPLRRTGSWRTQRPEIALDGCTRCWVCFVRCPEGAIALDAEDWPRIDYDVCKGCLICAEECPTHTIHVRPETRVWDDAPSGR